LWGSPNSRGVVLDAVRCAKLGLSLWLQGALGPPSAYFKKSPPEQYPDGVAREMSEDFIRKYGRADRRGAPASRASPPTRSSAPSRRGRSPSVNGPNGAAGPPGRGGSSRRRGRARSRA